jgi:hypothetical protein
VEETVGWIKENWFSLVQSVGIVAGLWFTAWSLHRTGRDQRSANRLALAQHHRELWSDPQRRPELKRVLDAEVDLVTAPVSVAEREFLIEVVYHFNTCWELGRNDGLVSLKALRLDAESFFSLPMPRLIWRETRQGRDPAFVAFIDSCLEKK